MRKVRVVLTSLLTMTIGTGAALAVFVLFMWSSRVELPWTNADSSADSQMQLSQGEPRYIMGEDGVEHLDPTSVGLPANHNDSQVLGISDTVSLKVFVPANFSKGLTVFDGLEVNGNLSVSGSIEADNIISNVLGGTGLTVAETAENVLTINNSDPGSLQNIIKRIVVGDDTFEAASNDTALTFSAGDNVSLDLDTTDGVLTFSATDRYEPSPFEESGTNIYSKNLDYYLGIGTSSPTAPLDVIGQIKAEQISISGTSTLANTTVNGLLTLNPGTANTAGVRFSQLTSASPVGVGGGKVLSVDSGGNMILVEDQTSVAAEDVLPATTTGGTLYYNGTNWVGSTNLYHNGGNVGISTDSPLARLHVYTNDESTIGLSVQRRSGQTADLFRFLDSNGDTLSFFDNNGVFNGEANLSGSFNPGLTEGAVTFQGSAGLSGDASNLFWDNSNKRLGIGTSTPDSSLDVVGNTTISGASTINIATENTLYSTINIGTNGTSPVCEGGFDVDDDCISIGNTGDRTALSLYGGNDWEIQRNGTAGFKRVNLDGLGGNHSIRSVGGQGVVIDTYGITDPFIIQQQTGNVGIGTTSPTSQLHLASTATTLGANGLGYFNWNPSSAASFTGDLFGINVGSNGSITGNIFSVRDNGSNLFSVSQSKITSALPHEFTASGNVSFGNDIVLSNSTLAKVKSSNASLELEAGPSFASNDLVLSTFNSGNVVVNSRSLNIGGGITRGLLTVDNTYRPLTGKALASLNQTEAEDIFTASASGETKVVITKDGNIGTGISNPEGQIHAYKTDGQSWVISERSQDIANGPAFLLRKSRANRSTAQVNDFLGGVYWQFMNDADEFHSGISVDGQVTSVTDGLESADFRVRLTHEGSHGERMRLTSEGLLGLGTTSPDSKLHVDGAVTGKALMALNETGDQDIFTASASGTTRFVIDNSGNVGIGTDDTSASYLTINAGSAESAINIGSGYIQGNEIRHDASGGLLLRGSQLRDVQSTKFSTTGAINQTSGDRALTRYDYQFEPTSGTAVQTGMLLNPTINQTGGANGITRGIYLNPTLTAAADWRSLEIANTSGFGIYQSGTGAINYLAGNTGIGTTTFGTNAASVLAIAGSTAPTTAITDGIQLWAEDDAGSHELRVMDEAGNITTLSPHNFNLIPGGSSEDLAWSFYSQRGTKAINADMTKALRLVEDLTGEQLVWIKDLESGEYVERSIRGIGDSSEIREQDGETSDLLADLKSKVDELTQKQDEMTQWQSQIEDQLAQLKNDADLDNLETDNQQTGEVLGDISIISEASNSATVSGKLFVTDRATFNDVGITGTLNVGTLWFDPIDSSIESLTGLQLQPKGMAGIEFVKGKLNIDTDGNLNLVEGVIAGNDQFRGQIELPAGETEVEVEMDWDTAPTTINITPSFLTTSAVTSIDETGFTVQVSQPSQETQSLYWIAIW